MKKYLTQAKYIAYNRRRATKSLKATQKSNSRNRSQNEFKNNIGKRQRYINQKYQNHKKVYAPTKFTFIGNPEKVIEFINRLKKAFNEEQPVFIVMRDVKEINYDAIVVLLSTLVRFKAKKIHFAGDFPKSKRARKILQASGFLKILFSEETIDEQDSYKISRKNIITHASREVTSATAATLISTAAETIWGEKRRCQGVQTTLIELMQNTYGHASPHVEGEKHWWLSVNHFPHQKKVGFSFVDYGIGIFQSLSGKTAESKWYQPLLNLKKRFKYGNNAELLRLILHGELHQTVTKEYYRGQGLPGIYESLQGNWFSNLHVISNDAHGMVSINEFEKLGNDFGGTFIYFEIDAESKNYR